MRGELGPNLDKSTDGQSPESADYEVTDITIDKLSIGQQYDVQDASHRWCEGEVQKIDRKTGSVFVTYVYWDSQFDEWISAIADRFAPLFTHTYSENGRLKKGQRIEVLDERSEWLEAFVVEDENMEGNDCVKVHYKGFHAKFDEWIPRTNASIRIRPYGRHKKLAQKQGLSSQSARPLQPQKQWKVPGSTRRPLSAGSAHMENIPGRQNRDGKSSNARLKSPGNDLPRINATSADNANIEQSHISTGHTNATGEDGSDGRTRRITSLSPEYVQYLEALSRRSLRVESVQGDGNCLFRAVAHQVYGDEELHGLVRQKCVDYMESESDFFSQFVEGGKDMFPLYLRAKRMDACWGDDPEIEAICELYDRRAEIWAFDATHGARKLRTFHETSLAGFQRDHHHDTSSSRNASTSSAARAQQQALLQQHREAVVIRLSYYGGGHYDSVVDPTHAGAVLRKIPGELEDAHIARAKERRVSRTSPGLLPPISSSREALAEAQRVSDAEATERETLEQVLSDSRDAYIRTGYDDLEACLALSMHGPMLKEDPTEGNNDADGAAAAEQDILRTVQEQSERDYYENAILSSLAADGKEDDSVLTEAELLHLAKQESEREAREREARFLGVNVAESRQDILPGRPLIRQSGSANTAMRSLTTGSDQVSRPPDSRDTPSAAELAHLSEDEALELALLQSLKPHSSATSNSTAYPTHSQAGSIQSSSSRSAAPGAVQDEGFHTEEELLQMALQASMQGYNHAYSGGNHNNSTARTTTVPAASGYAVNIGAPYVNVHANGSNGDYSEDMDEELMRAIEASLRK